MKNGTFSMVGFLVMTVGLLISDMDFGLILMIYGGFFAVIFALMDDEE